MMLLQLPSASAAAMAVDAPAPAAPAPPADAMALWENDTLQRVFRVTLNVRRAASVLCALHQLFKANYCLCEVRMCRVDSHKRTPGS